MYKYIDDCRKVALYVLVNADKSLVGLKFENCEIKEITVGDMSYLIRQTYGSGEVAVFHKAITSRLFPTETNQKLTSTPQNMDDITIIVLEETQATSFTAIHFFEAVKLFKSIDLYFCYFMNYKVDKNRLKWGGIGETTGYQHSLGFNKCKFSMTEEEKNTFADWFKQYKPFSLATETNEQFQKALRTYKFSYYIGLPDLEFIMLFTVFEMIFANSNTEISYQIARGVSLLLSNTSEEMNACFNRIKKLYTARSKYVHTGTSIKKEDLFELRELVRKIILKLIDMGYHQNNLTFDNLRNRILCSGVEKL